MDTIKKQEYKKPEIVEFSLDIATQGMVIGKGTDQGENMSMMGDLTAS